MGMAAESWETRKLNTVVSQSLRSPASGLHRRSTPSDAAIIFTIMRGRENTQARRSRRGTLGRVLRVHTLAKIMNDVKIYGYCIPPKAQHNDRGKQAVNTYLKDINGPKGKMKCPNSWYFV